MNCILHVSGESGSQWVEKVLQLYQITQLHHDLMMVGPSGSGKSMAWKILLKALERLEGVEGVSHIIDPKAISKEDLYGVLDPNTREWTDGLFNTYLGSKEIVMIWICCLICNVGYTCTFIAILMLPPYFYV